MSDALDRVFDLLEQLSSRRTRRGTAPDDGGNEPLEAEALALVESGRVDGELDGKDARGFTVLQAAIDADALAVAMAALDRGPALDRKNRGRALTDAAWRGMTPLVERLLAHDTMQRHRDEALVSAAKLGLPAMVEALLRAGADPSSERGQPALFHAAGPQRDEIRALLQRTLDERNTPRTPALGSTGDQPRKEVAGLRGIREFVELLVRTHPDWMILAVRKPIEEVTPCLARTYGAARAELDVAQRGAGHVTLGVFVLQLSGHDWTIELRSLGFIHRGRWSLDESTVASISRALGCDAVQCEGSDVSGTFSVTRFANGERVAQSDWGFGALDAADAQFGALDLYVPGCEIDNGGVQPRLDLLNIDPAAVKRVDYLVLEE